jgi:hypothetical protein
MMKHIFSVVFSAGILVFLSTIALAEGSRPIIREERNLVIDGIEETWRLEWVNPPIGACGPEDKDWFTCPCNGFAFGEWGNLRLVRKKKGQKDEALSLNQFFVYGDDFPTPNGVSEAVLQRWDVRDEDMKDSDSPGFAQRVRSRPQAEIMKFVDYDHDGRASEFTLQIGTIPCGKKTSVVVGISRKNGRLHAFSSAHRSEQPLVLTMWQWNSLARAKGLVNVSDGLCGDHGAEVEREVELKAENGTIYATRRTYQCNSNGQRGQLLGTEDY